MSGTSDKFELDQGVTREEARKILREADEAVNRPDHGHIPSPRKGK